MGERFEVISAMWEESVPLSLGLHLCVCIVTSTSSPHSLTIHIYLFLLFPTFSFVFLPVLPPPFPLLPRSPPLSSGLVVMVS